VIILFTLVAARLAGLFIGAPLFSRRSIPSRFKVMIVFMLAAVLVPAAAVPKVPGDAVGVAGALVGELSIGMAIGFLARLLVSAFQLAGSMIAFQMGFALARSFDPETGASSPVMGSLYLNLATMLFLLMDGHHFLIQAVAASFETFPVGAPVAFGTLTGTVYSSASTMYELGVRIAGPVTGLMLLTNATVGFINRVVPQLSIFNIGFPMTVMGGLLAVMLAVPEVGSFFMRAYAGFESQVMGLIGA
jgi:flagellar biosynthetic protein FliR